MRASTMRALAHAVVVVVVLTLLTQIGGAAYLAALAVVRAAPLLRQAQRWLRGLISLGLALAFYGLATAVLVPPMAAAMGRVRLPCARDIPGVVAASWTTCVLNRGFVTPQTFETVMALGEAMSRQFPGSRVTTLEGGFPFVNGFPLLPHLSHRWGRAVDLAFFYRVSDSGAPVPEGSPSPLGYFIFEQPRPGDPEPCVGRHTPLRWNFQWLQPDKPAWRLDDERTTAMINWLKEQPQVSRLFLEPHLAQRLGVAGGKLHFQGCRAARHDDHIHIELR